MAAKIPVKTTKSCMSRSEMLVQLARDKMKMNNTYLITSKTQSKAIGADVANSSFKNTQSTSQSKKKVRRWLNFNMRLSRKDVAELGRKDLVESGGEAMAQSRGEDETESREEDVPESTVEDLVVPPSRRVDEAESRGDIMAEVREVVYQPRGEDKAASRDEDMVESRDEDMAEFRDAGMEESRREDVTESTVEDLVVPPSRRVDEAESRGNTADFTEFVYQSSGGGETELREESVVDLSREYTTVLTEIIREDVAELNREDAAKTGEMPTVTFIDPLGSMNDWILFGREDELTIRQSEGAVCIYPPSNNSIETFDIAILSKIYPDIVLTELSTIFVMRPAIAVSTPCETSDVEVMLDTIDVMQRCKETFVGESDETVTVIVAGSHETVTVRRSDDTAVIGTSDGTVVVGESDNTVMTAGSDETVIARGSDVTVEAGESEATEQINLVRDHKRRTACIQNWKRNIVKRKRNAGEEYTSRSNKLVLAKSFTPFSNCKCKCTEHITVAEQKTMFDLYWKANRETKLAFLCGHVEQKKVHRRYCTAGESSRRQNTRIFTATKENGTNQVVCKYAFLKILAISNGTLDRALKRKSIGSYKEMRGRVPPRNKFEDIEIDKVRAHINSFPHYESHYNRAKSVNVKFLPQTLNLCLMHRLYKDQQVAAGQHYVSLSKYKQVFYTQFNLKFKKPKKDTCNKCDNFRIQIDAKRGTADELNQIVVERDQHQSLASAARAMLNVDRQICKDPNSKCQVLTFDLQSVLSTPRLSANVVYYKRQLSVYNCGIHECKEDKGIMCVWHEGMASRGAQEISSCLRKFVYSPYCNKDALELILWSDSCGGQNRNIKMSLSMLKVVQDELLPYKVITQKFLVSGHSFLPNDTDFSHIEKRSRNYPEIYTPSDWYSIMRKSRVSFPPFDVLEMKGEDFFSTKELEASTINRKRTTDGRKVNWLCMRQIQVRRVSPASLFFRNTYDPTEEWQEIDLSRRGKVISTVLQSLLYSGPKPLTDAKKRDLGSLMMLVPPIHHAFYEELNGTGKADDDVDGLPSVMDFEFDQLLE